MSRVIASDEKRSLTRRLPASPSLRRSASSSRIRFSAAVRASTSRGGTSSPVSPSDDELRRAPDGRRDDRPSERHRLEHDERQALGPRRQREDVRGGDDARGVVSVAGEDDAVSDTELVGPISKRPLIGAALLEVGADEHRARARQLRDGGDQLVLPLDVAEAPDLGDEQCVGRDRELLAEPVRVGRRRADAVVDDADAMRVALFLVRAPRVLGDRDERGRRSEPWRCRGRRAALASRGESGSRCGGATPPARARAVAAVRASAFAAASVCVCSTSARSRRRSRASRSTPSTL